MPDLKLSAKRIVIPSYDSRTVIARVKRYRERSVIRIESADVLASRFTNRQQAVMTFDTTEWIPSTEFFTRWLECEIGRPSTSFEDLSIEQILASQVIEFPEGFPRYEGELVRLGPDEGMFVPDVWHHFTIKINENA